MCVCVFVCDWKPAGCVVSSLEGGEEEEVRQDEPNRRGEKEVHLSSADEEEDILPLAQTVHILEDILRKKYI